MYNKNPTPSELRVLEEIKNTKKWRPHGITVLARNLGWKSNTYVLRCLQKLEKMGLVEHVKDGLQSYYRPRYVK